MNLLRHLICSLCRSDCSRDMVSGDGEGGGVIVGGCGCGVVGDCGFDVVVDVVVVPCVMVGVCGGVVCVKMGELHIDIVVAIDVVVMVVVVSSVCSLVSGLNVQCLGMKSPIAFMVSFVEACNKL